MGYKWKVPKLILGTWSTNICKDLDMMTVDCVGSEYYPYFTAWQNKRPGNMLLLVPEPANPYDKNAIAVYAAITFGNHYEWCQVGYVSKGEAKIIKNRMVDGGCLENTVLEASIASYKPGKSTDINLTGKVRVFVNPYDHEDMESI